MRPDHPAHVIQLAVAEAFGMTRDELLKRRHPRDFRNPARHMALALTRELVSDATFETIGRWFDGRDHSTVMNACRRAHAWEVGGNRKHAKTMARLRMVLKRHPVMVKWNETRRRVRDANERKTPVLESIAERRRRIADLATRYSDWEVAIRCRCSPGEVLRARRDVARAKGESHAAESA